jgi:hypothetical protein
VDDVRKKLLLERIRETGKSLEGRLPPSHNHPQGRNPYAHIPKVIKSVIGMSYTEAPNELYDDIVKIIDYCEKNPF